MVYLSLKYRYYQSRFYTLSALGFCIIGKKGKLELCYDKEISKQIEGNINCSYCTNICAAAIFISHWMGPNNSISILVYIDSDADNLFTKIYVKKNESFV
jgi:hypothetical protein